MNKEVNVVTFVVARSGLSTTSHDHILTKAYLQFLTAQASSIPSFLHVAIAIIQGIGIHDPTSYNVKKSILKAKRSSTF